MSLNFFLMQFKIQNCCLCRIETYYGFGTRNSRIDLKPQNLHLSFLLLKHNFFLRLYMGLETVLLILNLKIVGLDTYPYPT